ncbi:MAG TPA: TonB family protein [Pyrinomonadaceae bacterium]|nr:TonB family protein [Pyrinomonadaceae bacterium]
MSSKLAKIPALLLPILLCLSVLAQESTDAEAHFSRGEAYLQANQYNEAIREFHQATSINPKWPEAYFKLGVAYSAIPIASDRSGENSKAALEAFEAAVRLRPDWPEALNELGKKYTTFQQYDKAIRSLKEAIRLEPEFADAKQNLSIAFLYIGHYSEAVGCLQEAISLKPDRPLPHKLLGLAYLVLDDRDKALEQYRVLQALDQEMAQYLSNAIQSPSKPTFGLTSGKLISVPKPDYPAAAKSQGIFGAVTVEVAIDEKGKVTSAHAINGPMELHKAAEAAALKARFTSTKVSGAAVTIKGVITFNFVPQ